MASACAAWPQAVRPAGRPGYSAGHGVVGMTTQTVTFPAPGVLPTSLFAGLFFGNVAVVGDFTITGRKAAAVRHPDGSHRLMHCVESPEAWFEDFGTDDLAGGRASVALDPDFAALVRRDGFHVFLTAEGDCRGLYVAGRSKAGFEVRELQGGTSSLRFSWRVVARRRDVEPERLAKIRLPEKFKNAAAMVAPPAPPRSGNEGKLAESLRAKERGRARAKKKRT